jgi:hypothetical protein
MFVKDSISLALEPRISLVLMGRVSLPLKCGPHEYLEFQMNVAKGSHDWTIATKS